MGRKRNSAPFDDYLASEVAADQTALTLIFGELPRWLPEPVIPQLEQALAVLRNAGQSPERIAELTAQASRDELEIPGVPDVTAFIQAAYQLAHIQWALSLPKSDAIRELGGSVAAQNYLRSKAGREAQGVPDGERAIRNSQIRRRAQELAATDPRISSRRQAELLAPEFRLSVPTIRRILRGYGS